ncbi:MAG: 16S rRNA (adenine(1518)-N(6)/adenine(1519)-N(6))-dimethyltransferase RsmA [Candidatus Gastranaerophilaceae bacterium]|jgi:16S rRNA (adenine1518-N6/adenine1519-N6)-dimethyltransferase
MFQEYKKRARLFRPKKSLGQNFLIDGNVINKILEEAHLSKDEQVLEIGAGIGFVTEQLAQNAKEVIAIEVDTDAINELSKLPCNTTDLHSSTQDGDPQSGSASNIKIINQDILKTDISTLVEKPVKIVANIPYYITSPILVHLLGEVDSFESRNRNSIKEIILMVQYEVAKRIVADEKSPNKEYGALSVLCNYWAKTQIIQKVEAKSFWPAPKVDSALLKLEIRKTPLVSVENPKLFRKLVKASFGTRRKNIKNSLLIGGFDKETVDKVLKKLNIDTNRRGETLSMQELADMANFISNI